jgi:hypothetical protein
MSQAESGMAKYFLSEHECDNAAADARRGGDRGRWRRESALPAGTALPASRVNREPERSPTFHRAPTLR